MLAELLLGQPIFPGDSGVDQLVEIIKVLGTPTREQIREMNPNYTEFKFPQIKAHPWQKVNYYVSAAASFQRFQHWLFNCRNLTSGTGKWSWCSFFFRGGIIRIDTSCSNLQKPRQQRNNVGYNCVNWFHWLIELSMPCQCAVHIFFYFFFLLLRSLISLKLGVFFFVMAVYAREVELKSCWS